MTGEPSAPGGRCVCPPASTVVAFVNTVAPARAPNAVRARASAANPMIFIEPPMAWREGWRLALVNPTVEGTRGRSAKREGAVWPPPSPDVLPGAKRRVHALKLEPQPQEAELAPLS